VLLAISGQFLSECHSPTRAKTRIFIMIPPRSTHRDLQQSASSHGLLKRMLCMKEEISRDVKHFAGQATISFAWLFADLSAQLQCSHDNVLLSSFNNIQVPLHCQMAPSGVTDNKQTIVTKHQRHSFAHWLQIISSSGNKSLTFWLCHIHFPQPDIGLLKLMLPPTRQE
jgi:hypothetical protein